jgi:antitoxin component YwqK of YwqJK toxin-antitoxin module
MTEQTNQFDSKRRRHGVWENYFEDGGLWWKCHWHHGERHGLWEVYREDGTSYLKRYYLTIK